jgi:hypothetical protein
MCSTSGTRSGSLSECTQPEEGERGVSLLTEPGFVPERERGMSQFIRVSDAAAVRLRDPASRGHANSQERHRRLHIRLLAGSDRRVRLRPKVVADRRNEVVHHPLSRR